MTSDEQSPFIRAVDLARVRSLGPDERYVQRLLDHSSGARTCTVSYIRTPAGGGSPEGLHTHDVDQLFYVIGGTMLVEIQGRVSSAEPGTLVVFPAHVPHRNWNDGPEPTVHLSFNAPLPAEGEPFAKPVTAS
jgi:quercetin dioxygenase-like cupin family protein